MLLSTTGQGGSKAAAKTHSPLLSMHISHHCRSRGYSTASCYLAPVRDEEANFSISSYRMWAHRPTWNVRTSKTCRTCMHSLYCRFPCLRSLRLCVFFVMISNQRSMFIAVWFSWQWCQRSSTGRPRKSEESKFQIQREGWDTKGPSCSQRVAKSRGESLNMLIYVVSLMSRWIWEANTMQKLVMFQLLWQENLLSSYGSFAAVFDV